MGWKAFAFGFAEELPRELQSLGFVETGQGQPRRRLFKRPRGQVHEGAVQEMEGQDQYLTPGGGPLVVSVLAVARPFLWSARISGSSISAAPANPAGCSEAWNKWCLVTGQSGPKPANYAGGVAINVLRLLRNASEEVAMPSTPRRTAPGIGTIVISVDSVPVPGTAVNDPSPSPKIGLG